MYSSEAIALNLDTKRISARALLDGNFKSGSKFPPSNVANDSSMQLDAAREVVRSAEVRPAAVIPLFLRGLSSAKRSVDALATIKNSVPPPPQV